MAALNKLCLMLVFVGSAALLFKTGLSQVGEPSEGPEVDPEYAEGPESAYEQYLSDCADKLSNKCGDEVFLGTFFGNATVDHDCCLKLVNDMGKRCHHDLITFIIKSPKFKENATEIALKSEQIWNDCASFASPASQPA